ncbi:MAG: endonuclease [Lachnospiraceae bacterium]|nr:endonuclease [Lachnospiraceae bacterium]
MKDKKSGTFKKILIWIVSIIGGLFLCVALFFGWLTITEYRPKDTEDIQLTDSFNDNYDINPGSIMSILTWNVGYGALGENADFFMDGGKMVDTASEQVVKFNLESMVKDIKAIEPTFIFLQEVDVDSKRSHEINEASYFHEQLNEGSAYQAAFAYNFKVKFIPYPLPPIGKVNAGIMTLSAHTMDKATRVKLPTPFSWPVRLGNLKRCLLITRISAGDHELVLINVHLEAYDSGEGKVEQTKLLKSILDEEIAKGNYVIAGGDFNQTFSNVDTSMYPTYEGTWQCGSIDTSEFDGVSFVMDNTHPTCRSLDKPYAGSDKDTFQYYMIDGFIVSDNITVLSCETLNYGFKNTDHDPVYMQFKLKK